MSSDEAVQEAEGGGHEQEADKPKRGRKPKEAEAREGETVKWRAKRDNTLRGRYYRKGETVECAGPECPSEHFERVE